MHPSTSTIAEHQGHLAPTYGRHTELEYYHSAELAVAV